MPTGSMLYLMGVDTENLVQKVRGIPKVRLAVIDECQRYRDDVIEPLVKDVVRPALADLRGAIVLSGTPNPMGQQGYFWERWQNPKWSHHEMTIFDNDRLPGDIPAIIAEDLDAEGETVDGAWYRREYLAQWVVDVSERVYAVSDDLIYYDTLPSDIDSWVFGVDLGTKDADVIAPIGWCSSRRCVYLAHEDVQTGQTVDGLGEKIAALHAWLDPITIAADSGGGGAKTILSIQHAMPDIPLVAAVKPPVKMQVKMLNNLLREGRFKVPRSSRFVRDARLARWVGGVVGGKVDETGSKHSDLVPACRYAVIAAMPFLPPETPDDIRPPSAIAAEANRAAYLARIREIQPKAARQRDDDGIDMQDDSGGM